MSKKSTQKPEASTTEKTEAVAGMIETVAEETPEDAPAQEQTEATQVSVMPASESADPHSTLDAGVDAAPDASEELSAPEPAPLPEPPLDLAVRLTKTVAASLATGNPEAVQALHKAEMIVGDLKNALPAAIAAADESLKADLQSLLALL